MGMNLDGTDLPRVRGLMSSRSRAAIRAPGGCSRISGFPVVDASMYHGCAGVDGGWTRSGVAVLVTRLAACPLAEGVRQDEPEQHDGLGRKHGERGTVGQNVAGWPQHGRSGEVVLGDVVRRV